MIIANLSRLFAIASTVWPGQGPRVATQKVKFVLSALAIYDSVQPFLAASPESTLGKLMAFRPQMLGAVVWPYQCVDWGPRTRLARIREHCSVVTKIGAPINFPVGAQLELLDLNDIYEGLSVVVDQPE